MLLSDLWRLTLMYYFSYHSGILTFILAFLQMRHLYIHIGNPFKMSNCNFCFRENGRADPWVDSFWYSILTFLLSSKHFSVLINGCFSICMTGAQLLFFCVCVAWMTLQKRRLDLYWLVTILFIFYSISLKYYACERLRCLVNFSTLSILEFQCLNLSQINVNKINIITHDFMKQKLNIYFHLTNNTQ